MSDPIRPIRPEMLAAKIEQIQNYEQPHLLEEFGQEPQLVRVLWFLQYVSRPENYPGGLSKFSADLIASEQDLIGTRRSQMISAAKGYTLTQAVEVLRELPQIIARERLFSENYWLADPYVNRDLPDPDTVHQSLKRKRRDQDAVLLKTLTPAAIKRMCTESAQEGLANYFKKLCELPHVGLRAAKSESPPVAAVKEVWPETQDGRDFIDFSLSMLAEAERERAREKNGAPWYFTNVADAILSFMQKREEALLQRIAETEVTRVVTRWIAKSRNTRRSVMIIGNSRFGKTEAIKLNAEMNPGSCRLVNTPASNAPGDLLREVAKSLGMELGPQNVGRDLRERIDYVLRFSNLQLIFDESQLLLPGNYSRNTAPARLNWVRRSIMDQDIPAVFVCTPQSYLPAKRRFITATGFAMEQFDERILKTVQLPEELSEADLLAVARIHFPQLAYEYLHFVVNKALATERNFVSDIEKIATLAKDNAREQDRKQPTLADIEAAMADVLPFAPAPINDRPATPGPNQPIQRPCKRPANPLQPARIGSETLPQFSREIRPVMLTT
jgi:hypothetical protein